MKYNKFLYSVVFVPHPHRMEPQLEPFPQNEHENVANTAKYSSLQNFLITIERATRTITVGEIVDTQTRYEDGRIEQTKPDGTKVANQLSVFE